VVGISNSCKSKVIVTSAKLPDQFWGPNSLLINGNWAVFLEVKRSGCNFYYPPPSVAEVKTT
jgi:hypothetical protein